jgi:hypothetical protein
LLSYLSIGLLLFVLVRLARYRRHLRWFMAFLTLKLLQYCGTVFVEPRTNLYRQWWIYSESILLVYLVLVVLESYNSVTREIYDLGRIGTVVALAAIVLAFSTEIAIGRDSSADWSARLAQAIQVKRGVLTILSVALIAVIWFYQRFPIPVAHYVWPHARVLLAYLSLHAVGYWGIAISSVDRAPFLDQSLTAAWCGCLAAWYWIFSRPLVPKPALTGEEDLEEANRRAKQLERTIGF